VPQPSRLPLAVALVALLPLAAAVRAVPPVPPAAGAAVAPASDSVVVSTAWLAERLRDPRVVVVQVGMPARPGAPGDGDLGAFAAGHVPGAHFLDYRALLAARDGLEFELPDTAAVRPALEAAGVRDDARVVLYGAPVPVARALYTLEALGHARVSVLDGGLAAWRAEGRPLATGAPPTGRGRFTPRLLAERRVDAAWVQARLGARGVALLDTRTPGEFDGTAGRSGYPSEGHLRGARLLEWQSLFSEGTAGGRLRTRAELTAMLRERGVAPGDTLVTYCWVGARASVTYLLGRYLGHPTRMYDGSYQDWQRRGLPVDR
jgi:thiosulfate/3-mercaptopyruvate sulfurtransferase